MIRVNSTEDLIPSANHQNETATTKTRLQIATCAKHQRSVQCSFVSKCGCSRIQEEFIIINKSLFIETTAS